MSQATVRRYIRLLNLAPSIQDDLLTADGPVGVGALSMLAHHFVPEEQEKVRELIAEFRYNVQIDIIRESGGNLERLVELREEVLSDAFDIPWCREGLCFRMPAELKAEVIRRVEIEG